MMELSYRLHRFPPVVIQHAVWLYLRFSLSYRDVEDLLAERGLDISYKTVRSWVLKFGPVIPRRLRQRRPRPMWASSHLSADHCAHSTPTLAHGCRPGRGWRIVGYPSPHCLPYTESGSARPQCLAPRLICDPIPNQPGIT